MKLVKYSTLWIILMNMWACQQEKPVETKTYPELPPKVFYINSYRPGVNHLSDEMMRGIEHTLSTQDVKLLVFFLNSTNKRTEDALQKSLALAKKELNKFQPSVIISSDDEALKHFIIPEFKDTNVPVLFCGVDWDCEQYGLPTKNITGMLEVLPLKQNLDTIKNYFPESKKVTFLSANTEIERNEKQFFVPIFESAQMEVTYELVNTYDEWKEKFIEANESSDLVYVSTHEGIENWDEEDAIQFVKEKINKPVITSDDYMMPIAVFGMSEIAKEQGIWCANTAWNLIKGKTIVSEVALSQNHQSKYYLNPILAEKIGFEPSEALKNKCEQMIF